MQMDGLIGPGPVVTANNQNNQQALPPPRNKSLLNL